MQGSHNGLSLTSPWVPSTLSPHTTSDDHETHRSSISARMPRSPHKFSQSSTADRTATVVPELLRCGTRPSSPVPVGGSSNGAPEADPLGARAKGSGRLRVKIASGGPIEHA